MARPAVFFDRDGVLVVDHGYTYRLQDLQWTPGAREGIKLCKQAGYWVFVVTNQSGISRGLYSEPDVSAFHDAMQKDLQVVGTQIDDFRYCPHHPDALRAEYRCDCECRKPKPGMITRLIQTWPIEREKSFLIGDKLSDIEAASAAGIAGYLYRSGPLDEFLGPLLQISTPRGGGQ